MTQEHPDDFDSPWKEALEQALPDFLALFFPEAHAGTDWSRGYRFRDKELPGPWFICRGIRCASSALA